MFSATSAATDADGWPIEGVIGYAQDLRRLIAGRPTYVASCFDCSLRTGFRHQLYPPYKINRPTATDEIKRQFEYCRALTRAFGIRDFGSTEFEADDLIASLASVARREHRNFTIISKDKDLAQLLGPGDAIWDGRAYRMTSRNAVEKFGVEPNQIPDWQALCGDTTDGIPGIRGIGPKLAGQLIRHFGDIDRLFDDVERFSEIPTDFPGGNRAWNALQQQRENATLFRRLTTLRTDAPTITSMDEIKLGQTNIEALQQLEDQLGLKLI